MRRRGAVVVAVVVAACRGTDDADPLEADAVTYIVGYCTELVDKEIECGELEETDRDTWMEGCIDFRTARQTEFPCFMQEVEFGRCRAERVECADYTESIMDSPGTVCYEFIPPSLECLNEYFPNGTG
jgi:hypothetical protein